MTLETVFINKTFGGVLGVYTHRITATGTGMTFSVFVPGMAHG
ncbi:MAG: hypothetical protein R3E21_02270 [Caenibius sp.]